MRPAQQWVRRSANYKWWAAAATITVTAVEVSHLGAVNIALPSIADRFNSGLPAVQWVATGHMLAISALVLPMGRLSDMAGRKRVFVSGMLVSILGSMLAGIAPNLSALILFRVLQGIGPAMVIANGMAIVTSLFPDQQRGAALGLHMMAVGLGLVAGPAMGGFLVATVGWRYVFLVNLPLGLLCLLPFLFIVEGRRLQEGPARPQGSAFDWPGAAMSTLALLLFLLAVTNGHRLGWDSAFILAGLAGSVGLLGAFVWWELRVPVPVLDLKLFISPMVFVAVAARCIFFITGATPLFLMPFFLLGVAGYSASKAGLIMTAMALTMVVTGPVGGWLTDGLGWRPVAVAGAAISALALLLLANLTSSTPPAVIVVVLSLQSSSHSFFTLPINSAILASVGRDRQSGAVAFLQMLRNVFTVTGIAVATVIVTVTMESKGLEPSLRIITDVVDVKAALAFTSGTKIAFLAMGGLQAAVVLLLVVGGPWVLGLFWSGLGKPGASRSLPE